jgi:hypothetical protein
MKMSEQSLPTRLRRAGEHHVINSSILTPLGLLASGVFLRKHIQILILSKKSSNPTHPRA